METILEDTTKVVIIGIGGMGGGMANQLRQNAAYDVTEVRRGDDLAVLRNQDITLAAMRPQQWGAVDKQTGKHASEEIIEHVNERGIFTWIMAGITMRRVRDDLGSKCVTLVRAMPNLAVDGYSQIGLYAQEGTLSAEQKAQIEAFYAQFGRHVWLESEDQFPEYTIFTASMIGALADYLENFRQEAVKDGFGEDQSEAMLSGALRAAAHLVDQGYTLRQLRDKVMTPSGITEAMILASRRRNAQRRLTRAMVKAGVRRSHELAKR